MRPWRKWPSSRRAEVEAAILESRRAHAEALAAANNLADELQALLERLHRLPVDGLQAPRRTP